MKKKISKKGFTLVELLVSISILTILTSASVIGYLEFTEKARLSNDQQLVSQINNLIKAEDTYSIGIGSSNDALDIQNILKEQGISEIKTQSKGNYIFWDNENRKAVLGKLDENGLNISFAGDTSSTSTVSIQSKLVKGNFNVKSNNLMSDDNIKTNENKSKGNFLKGSNVSTPEGFIEGYTFITTESKDGLAQEIRNIRNGGGEGDARKSRDSIQKSLDSIKSKNKKVNELLEEMKTHVVFVNDSNNLVKFNQTKNEDVDTVIFSSNVTTITKDVAKNFENYNVAILDLPSSVNDIEDGAVKELAKVSETMNISTSSKELVNKIKEKSESANIDSETKDSYNKISEACKKVEERKQEISSINLTFRNKLNGSSTAYTSNLTTKTNFNNRANSIKVNLEMDIEFLKEQTDYLNGNSANSNLYFDGYYLIDENGYDYGKINESSGKLVFKRTDIEKGIPENLIIEAHWENKDSAKFKVFGNDLEKASDYTYVFTQKVLTFSDSIVFSLVNTNQYEEVFSEIAGFGTHETKVGGFDQYTIYQIDNEYTLKTSLSIPSNVSLYIPYTNKFDTLQETSDDFTYLHSYYKETYGCEFTEIANDSAKAIKTFTIDKNVEIYNYGEIRVGAKLYSKQGQEDTGKIAESYGYLVNNSSLINNGGTIYIMGKAKIDSDATLKCVAGTIYEEMVIQDWHGGTNAAGCQDGNVSPFNYWKLENIEGKVILEEDCNYYASMVVRANNNFNVGYLPIVGDDGFFNVHSFDAYIEKYYENGKLNLDLSGNIIDNPVIMNIIGYEFDLSNIPFPLSNMNINLNKGANLSLSKNKYKILPGSSIQVKEGANLNIETEFATYEKFERPEYEAKWSGSKYKYNSKTEAAYIKNSGVITISGGNFSGDIKQCGGFLKISKNTTLTTNFKEGYGTSSSCGYELVEESKLVTGSYNNQNYDYRVNKTKIIIDNKEYLIENAESIENSINDKNIKVF